MTGCSSTSRPEKENKLTDTLSVQSTLDDNPKVEVKISLIDSVVKRGDKVLINITLTNTDSTNQRLLFDKPIISTGGPWSTTSTVIDTKTNKSILKYENKAILSSQIYSKDHLTDKYYNLTPNQSINAEYELTDIVVFKTEDNLLPKGNYAIQIFYYSNISNIVALTIK